MRGFASVSEQGLLQRRTPDAVRSRVAGAVEAATLLSLAVSLTVGGPIVEWLGPRRVLRQRRDDAARGADHVRPMRFPGVPAHQADRPRVRGAEPVTADRVANP